MFAGYLRPAIVGGPHSNRKQRPVTAAFGLKRLAIAAAALIAAVLIAVIGVYSLLPAASVRDAVKAEIRAVTGLDPVLGDDISLSLFPSGSVRFHKEIGRAHV